MYLNATEAQWRNVQQQYVNNDCGIFRRQSSYATLSRDHVGAAAADSWIFDTILYRFEQAEAKVLRCENVNSSSFIPGAEYKLSLQREDVFVWASQLQRSV